MILSRKFAAYFFTALAMLLAAFATFAQSPEAENPRIDLRDGWMLQSSCKISESGGKISKAGFRTDGWHATTVPSTVVAALVADKTYPDPYFGDNLRSLPGMNYPVGKMFSVRPMPKDSPFRCGWWYRTEFPALNILNGQHVWLNFGGINNRANIWLNGKRLADSREVAGAYRTYEFDVTSLLATDRPNALAVESIAQTEKDLGINWVDWNPTPPDKNMGLWRGVWLRTTGAVEIRSPLVITHFANASLAEADLTVEAEMRNASEASVSGTLEAELEGHKLRQPVSLAAGESRTIRFTPDKFPDLRIQNPELWWPHQMGAPALHPLSLRLLIDDQESDSASIRYGIREVTSDIDPQGHLLFRVNGKRILIRGGGWAPDMLLRETPERLKLQFQYVRDLNLNTIRLEGPTESDKFFDLADQQGILVMAGWTCCDYWQKWTDWKQSDIEIATASLRSQISRLRSHPSMLAWLNGSDQPPPAAVERPFLSVLKELDWPNPVLSSASENTTPISGQTGVKMRGPYDYTPPDYWLADTSKFGGAYGFATEIGDGCGDPAVFEPAKDAARGSHRSRRSHVELPRRLRAIQQSPTFRGRHEGDLWRAGRLRRLRAQVASHGLRFRARHVRGLFAEQIRLDRRGPVDAQQRVAVADLAPLGLLFAARRRILRREKGLRTAARDVFLRRPQRCCGEQHVSARIESQRDREAFRLKPAREIFGDRAGGCSGGRRDQSGCLSGESLQPRLANLFRRSRAER